jgi:hypothetical protein
VQARCLPTSPHIRGAFQKQGRKLQESMASFWRRKPGHGAPCSNLRRPGRKQSRQATHALAPALPTLHNHTTGVPAVPYYDRTRHGMETVVIINHSGVHVDERVQHQSLIIWVLGAANEAIHLRPQPDRQSLDQLAQPALSLLDGVAPLSDQNIPASPGLWQSPSPSPTCQHHDNNAIHCHSCQSGFASGGGWEGCASAPARATTDQAAAVCGCTTVVYSRTYYTHNRTHHITWSLAITPFATTPLHSSALPPGT